jgi:hypothetical protein
LRSSSGGSQLKRRTQHLRRWENDHNPLWCRRQIGWGGRIRTFDLLIQSQVAPVAPPTSCPALLRAQTRPTPRPRIFSFPGVRCPARKGVRCPRENPRESGALAQATRRLILAVICRRPTDLDGSLLIVGQAVGGADSPIVARRSLISRKRCRGSVGDGSNSARCW